MARPLFSSSATATVARSAADRGG